MKKHILFAVCTVIILSVSTICYSAGPYVSGNLGLAIARDSDVTDSTTPGFKLEIESDTGLALGGAIGYGFGDFRVEGEVAYQRNNLDKGTLSGVNVNLDGYTSSLAFLLNGYWDFVNSTPFTPFISGGLGVASVKYNDFNYAGSGEPDETDSDSVFAYQIGAGVAYAIDSQVSIDLKYRYFATSDPEFDTVDAEYSSHNFYIGVRFNF